MSDKTIEKEDKKTTTQNQESEKQIKLDLEGREIIVSTGRLARSANGSVTIQCGDTMLLVTAVKSEEPREDIDFFPLLCDFEERIAAVGRIPGSYNRRENKPPDKSVLICRLMDRPLRPLFPENFYNDVQVVATALSIDQVNPPDTLAMLGASFALELSNIPFKGPIGAVRVGLIHNKFIANPTFEEIEKSELDLVVAGTIDSIMMVEAGAELVTEEILLNALAFAQTVIKQQVEAQIQFAKQYGKKKNTFSQPEKDKTIIEIVEKHGKESLLKSISPRKSSSP